MARFAEEVAQVRSALDLKRVIILGQSWGGALALGDYSARAFGKLSTTFYGYMWGPSEFTVTGTLKNYDRSNQLAGITVPTLFTCGEFDEATPAANNYYKSLIPGSEIHVFSGASHAHHLEKSAEFLSVVRDFMHRCEAGKK